MKNTVDITDAALEDMDEIYDYIRVAFRAPDTAAAASAIRHPSV